MGHSALEGVRCRDTSSLYEQATATPRAAELSDDAAALAYACELVRELMQGLTPTDRGSLVKVRDETRPIVFSIPFLCGVRLDFQTSASPLG